MKKRNRILTVALSAMLLASTLFATSCGGGGTTSLPDIGDREQESVDKSKTQLYVGNYNGGIGEAWLWEAKELFEKDHKDVQIMIDNGKDEYGTSSLMSNIKSNRQDMYVVDSVAYYTLANAGHMADLTEIVKKGDDSIEKRMNTSLRDYYKTKDGKYYAVPFYEAFYSMTYDVDLFDEYKLWLNEDGTDFVTSLEEPRYKGISGENDAWDEGLPRTYTQFFRLLDKMVQNGITPLTWSGKFKDTYLKFFTNGVIADYMGSDYIGNYTFNGKAKTLNRLDFNEPATGTFALPSDVYGESTYEFSNAEETLANSAAKYYATKFSKDLMSGGNKYVNQLTITSTSETHLMAQSTFLRSRYKGSPIGMLIDGGWWYNEAAVTMDSMSSEYGKEWSKTERRFGVMPIPKADDGSSAGGHTFSATGGSCIFVSAYSKKQELAKEFFEFIHTREAMSRFTKTSWSFRPYEYDISESDLKSLPYYIQNVYNCIKSSDVIFTVPKSTSETTLIQKVDNLANMMGSKVGSDSYGLPLLAFFDKKDLSVMDYFKGIKNNKIL